MIQGRTNLNQCLFEPALQSFTAALHMTETNRSLSPLKFRVLGEIGWVNRLAGRYAIALQYLEEAISLADSLPGPPTLERAFIDGELGMVYRLTDRYDEARDAFTRQYELSATATNEEDQTRVACRAIGNLGMANYQRALELLSEKPDDPNIRHKTKECIRLAISQLEERVRLAQVLRQRNPPDLSPRGRIRSQQSLGWKCIGLSRLSLCYTTMAELDLEQKESWTGRALKTSKEAVDEGQGNAALTLSRFFHGRALLFSARDTNDPGIKAQALECFNEHTDGNIATAAVGLCTQPSAEHRSYLRELVSAGGDLQTPDPSTGYTALDYAVFSGDHECATIVLDGLRERLVSEGHSAAAAQVIVDQQRTEARLRKGYRETFQDRFRPELVKQSEKIIHNDDSHQARRKNRALRRETIMNLRRIYAEDLAADPETSRMFDHLKVIKYTDFVKFGKLPRSSDGLAAALESKINMELENEDDGEFVIFFSYRWINKDPSLNSPDDANRTQYKSMIDAIETYLKLDTSISRDNLLIWMVFHLIPVLIFIPIC